MFINLPYLITYVMIYGCNEASNIYAVPTQYIDFYLESH